jgi:hypothetical protein
MALMLYNGVSLVTQNGTRRRRIIALPGFVTSERRKRRTYTITLAGWRSFNVVGVLQNGVVPALVLAYLRASPHPNPFTNGIRNPYRF